MSKQIGRWARPYDPWDCFTGTARASRAGGWLVGPKAGLDALRKEKFLTSARNRSTPRSIPQLSSPWYSHYIDCAIPAITQ